MQEKEIIPELQAVEEKDHPAMTALDTSLMYTTSIKYWLKSYELSKIPFIVLNKDLRILWENSAYSQLLNYNFSTKGRYLPDLFQRSFDHTIVQQINEKIWSMDGGYSWQGRVEIKRKDILNILVNLLIIPLLDLEDKEPQGYAAIFNDVTEENRALLRNTFLSLLEASKLKDNDTGKHIQRVNSYSKLIAQALYALKRYPEIDTEFIENIGFLAAMHDVGKIGTPDSILNKPGRLNDEEWKTMKEHTINGAFILNTYPNPMAKQIALSHHERWDGSGYPYGLSGEMIPLAARIVTLADIYDALRMERIYKAAYPAEKASEIIIPQSGTTFEPIIVDIYKKMENRFHEIYEINRD